MKKVNIIEKKRVFDEFFKIDATRLQYEKHNGEMTPEIRLLNFERGDSVAAIIWHKEKQKVILTEQFRYPTYEKGPGWITEIIAGGLKQNEIPEEALIREIEEEIGYHVTEVEHISTFYVSPGGTSERILLYYTEVADKDKKSQGGGLDIENEDIKEVQYTMEELWAIFKAGKLIDAKSIIGFIWLKDKLGFKA
ncbi:MAG: NUDIX hydrolase [Flammeovirgaceae bacterium]|nr:NUDIX hydrolase [Flammeovirgaceae bacterium]